VKLWNVLPKINMLQFYFTAADSGVTGPSFRPCWVFHRLSSARDS